MPTKEEIERLLAQAEAEATLELANALEEQRKADARVKAARATLAAVPRLHKPKQFKGRAKRSKGPRAGADFQTIEPETEQ